MKQHFLNILRLGIKELYGLKADVVLVAFIVYTFTLAIFAVANGAIANTLTSGPASRNAEANTASAGESPDSDSTVGIQ